METLHINLVSEHITANLIPTLSDSNCIGVVLVQGDDKLESKNQMLCELYKRRNIPVLKQLIGTSSHFFSQLNRQANELIDYLVTYHKDKCWVLNVTCGTKPMSLAMTLAMQNYNAQCSQESQPALIIYTDSQNKAIHILNNQQSGSLPYQSILTLEELLMANRFTINNCIDSSNDHFVHERAELTRYLGKQFSGKFQGMLGQLQWAASEAAKNHKVDFSQTIHLKNKEFSVIYNRLAGEGLIQCQWHEHNNEIEIQFNGEDACRYLAGLWLEEFTYLQALECGFEEVAMSVEGVWNDDRLSQEQGKNNEFDMLIRHNNQLLTVECKARNWDSKAKQLTSEQDILHKLDNLGSKLGGLYAQNLLVSAYTLTGSMLNRAQTNQIIVCDNVTQDKLLEIFKRLKKQMGN
jgi:hypothetical protein